MKKLLLILLGMPLCAFAQTIPNGAFEKWTDLSYDNPNNWVNANIENKEDGIYTVTKVSGATGFALRMETKSLNSKIVESWVMSTEGDPRVGEGGYPYTQKPSTFTGKFRCNIMAGDTGFMVAMFKKNGIIIGSSTATFIGITSTFSTFSFPVLIGTVPDSLILVGSSSNLMNEVGVQAGSWLELDELAFGGTGITQPILNGNFESWTHYSNTTIQDWNMFGEDGCSRVEDPFRGSYAIKLRTFNDPQDGLRQCGIRLSEEINGQTNKHGVPYTLAQDTLFGYYKLSTPGTDHAYIFARTFKNGLMLGWFGKELYPSASYQYFEIVMSSPSSPDSLDVSIESSSKSTMVEGTTLIIDEIQLKSSKLSTGISELKSPFTKGHFSVYPSPANEVLNINTDMKGSLSMKVYTMNGKEVKVELAESSNRPSLDIRHLNPGLYLISIATENGQVAHSRFIKN